MKWPRRRLVSSRWPHSLSVQPAMISDSACANVLQPEVLHAIASAVDITKAGSLEEGTTPLIAALQRSFLRAAQVLLDAGADVNALSKDGMTWPLAAAAHSTADAGMVWLLGHGELLTLANRNGAAPAHLLAAAGPGCKPSAGTSAEPAKFCCRWLRRIIATEPSLLDARDETDQTPLLAAVLAASETGAATLLELGADVGLVTTTGGTVLCRSCGYDLLSIVPRCCRRAHRRLARLQQLLCHSDVGNIC